jgi:hypothetical protein
MKADIATTDKVRDVTAEARENLEDIYAEVKAERGDGTEAPAQDIPVGMEDSGTTSGTAGEQSGSRRGRARGNNNA